ncbi:MAG: ATP-binding cassette transporter 1 [Benniella sp.]|nr:MAG: ATP-binding cassette transporter 1 [Benniella sp.]
MAIWNCRADGDWGPIDPDCPADFTPCFENGALKLLPIVFLLLMGIPRLSKLQKQASLEHPCKNWKHVVKLTGIVLVIIASSVLLVNQYHAHRPSLDAPANPFAHLGIEFWASLLELLAFCLAFHLAVIENRKSFLASNVLLLFWLFSFAINGVRLRTLIANCPGGKSLFMPTWPSTSSIEQYFVGGRFVLLLVVFVLECLRRDTRIQLDEDGYEQSPEEKANVFSLASFFWVTDLMRKGYNKPLTKDDLWQLRADDRSKHLSGLLEGAWYWERRKKSPSLARALARAFGKPFYGAAIWKFICDTMAFLQPVLLREFLQFVMSYKTSEPQPLYRGYTLATLMFVCSLTQTTCLHQYFHLCFRTGMRLRAGLVTIVYQKALRLSNSARQQSTVGEIVNHMSVDAQRIQDLVNYLHLIWSSIYQMSVIVYLLYWTVGWAAFAGVGVMILMMPLNAWLYLLYQKYEKKYMEHKDSRIKLMNELLNGIRVIKLYAWENTFLRQILATRNDLELDMLKKIGYVSAVETFTWSATPFLVSLSTFTLYTLVMKQTLTTDILFSAIALFNLLKMPLSALPWVLSSSVEARVSMNRLYKFLTCSEVDPYSIVIEDSRYLAGSREATNKYTVLATDATYSWQKDAAPVVSDINLVVKREDLLTVIGRVGSGKSSLIAALCGDLERFAGEIRIRGTVALVPQQPWIMNETLRANILFGHPYDPVYYQQTIEACCLQQDFDMLPGGDMTEIGERGINLSGGQKARISLARAVYSRADIYLLDDPLSAVDANVGRTIFDKVIGPNGLLADKTRIFVTHQIQYLGQSTSILMLREGKIVEQGNFEELMKKKTDVYQLVTEFGKDKHHRHEKHKGSSSTEDREDTSSPSTRRGSTISSGSTLRRSSSESTERPKAKDPKHNIIVEEEMKQGSVHLSVYWTYVKACSLTAVASFLVAMACSESAQVGMTLWLTHWSKAYDSGSSSHGPFYYIGIYASIGIAYSAVVILQNIILQIFCGLRSARVLHENMLKSVLRSPMMFFDTTPMGRILNRFSKDQGTVDDTLPRTFSGFAYNFYGAISIIVVITFSTPLLIFVLIPVGFAYLILQRYFLAASRELRRLDSVSRSPIFAHFQESVGGVSTIRAYRQQSRFIQDNEKRLDQNLRAFFPSIAGNRWLGWNLEILGSTIIFGSAFLSVLSLARHISIDSGLVGLSLTYALSVTQTMNWMVRMYTEVETNIVSVERIQEYVELQPEAPEIVHDHRPPHDWPAEGRVVFSNFETRYRPGLDLVLRGVNFTIQPREKVGICGRTGAGKSSLTLSLFRIIEAAHGQISVDGIDISTLGLYDVRSRFSIIPQDPVLFIGSIRFNLDPLGALPDQELWQALEDSHLKSFVSGLEGGLSAVVHEGGDNFSVGQRQLICLARALLRKTSLLILDEATAAIDLETDALVQKIIRQKFSHCTILTIAHRINTVMDSDKIMVLDHGQVVEFDSPKNLLKNRKSVFYSLAKESGNH